MSDGGKSARSDLLGGAGWIVFGLLIGVEALRMDRFTQMGSTLYTMPGFMPGLIGGVLMLLGTALAGRGWRAPRPERQAGASIHPRAAEEPPARLFNTRAFVTLALTLGYALGLIGRVHFVLATTLFVTAFVWLFTPPQTRPLRRAIAALAAGLGTALVVFFVFEDLFLVRLP